MRPSEQVLKAFGVRGDFIVLSGGQGTTFRVGETVLKTTHNEVEAIWAMEILSGLEDEEFRVPRYLTSDVGEVLVDGWMAYELLPGEMVKGRWKEKRWILDVFHKALKDVPPPSFFAHRDDPWALADFMAWEEMPIRCHERLNPAVEKLVECLQPIQVKNQIIQGDPNNILFSEAHPPAIIDFCPYWRPPDFAFAVLVVDALVWGGAKEVILTAFEDIRDFHQLLVRAELRRILEIDGHYRQFGKDCLGEVNAHLPTIEFICSQITEE